MTTIESDFYKPIVNKILQKMDITGNTFFANKEASDMICEWIEHMVPQDDIDKRYYAAMTHFLKDNRITLETTEEEIEDMENRMPTPIQIMREGFNNQSKTKLVGKV